VETYRSEEEQIEALKRWWDENGRSTIVAVIVALALGFGWQGWQKYRDDQAVDASNRYQSLLQSLSTSDEAAAEDTASGLKLDYAGSIYAQFAALHLARMHVIKGELPAAETELRWVLAHAEPGSETAQIAQLRLARVLAASGDFKQALGVLDAADPGSFSAAYQMARGDILLMQEDREGAKEAYSTALMEASSSGEQVNISLLREKLKSLSPQPPRPVTAEAAADEAAQAAPAPAVQADGEE